MSATGRQKADEEVIKFAKHWARFRFAVSDINAIEATIKAYNEIVAEGAYEKTSGTYYIALEVPKVFPTILLEIFNGRDMSIEMVFYEEKIR